MFCPVFFVIIKIMDAALKLDKKKKTKTKNTCNNNDNSKMSIHIFIELFPRIDFSGNIFGRKNKNNNSSTL